MNKFLYYNTMRERVYGDKKIVCNIEMNYFKALYLGM